MSWCANGWGRIYLKPNGIPQNVIDQLDEMQEFELHSRMDRNDEVEWTLCYDGNFHEDCVESYLNVIAEYVDHGDIEMQGEEDTYWKYVFKDGHWHEVSGRIAYEDEFIKCSEINRSNENKLSFLHDIIDVFENFLEDKGIVIENPDKEQSGDSASNIYGCDYMDLESEIECVMKNWEVIK